ncbi:MULTISPECIES: TetR family transcriptional regulator [Mycobacteriaceae]|nr:MULTISPECIES: TetR family transcriptional regulator [Mycobacteriaceae]QPG68806.1 TetR family transcriptional regulator [Mycolicibacterium mucogenicum DSM 44124]SEA81058.1 DNA-binding transcriptional regulator, AcrR family [Mycobacterium sp. 283mftsu]
MAAAKVEFSALGFAGARLNRIAAEANASKERLYSYFQSKQNLFEAVVEQWIQDAPYDAIFKPDDVPAYAVALFDYMVADPVGARLQRWIELEAAEGMFGDHVLRRIFQSKLDRIAEAQRSGIIDASWRPMDLLVLLNDMTYALAAGGFGIDRIVDQPLSPETAAVRRAAVAEAARRLVQQPAGE